MAKKRSVSSREERRIPASSLFTRPIDKREREELKALARMPDAAVDYSDAPAAEHFPPEIHVGKFYRPVKQQISLRVDADVLAWFRSRGGKYQTYMNQVLRREMRTRARAR
jgi:uncharacterized protein (DUF4415 family)